MVVFWAELEVAEHDGDLSTGDDEDEEYESKEAEDVVEGVQPDGGEDEEELDENCSERKDSTNQAGEDGVDVPRLLRNLHVSEYDLIPKRCHT